MEQPEPAETSLLAGLGGKEKALMETAGGCPWSPTVSHPFKPAAGWFEVLEQLGMNLELLGKLPHHCMLPDPSGPARAAVRWAAGAVPGKRSRVV